MKLIAFTDVWIDGINYRVAIIDKLPTRKLVITPEAAAVAGKIISNLFDILLKK